MPPLRPRALLSHREVAPPNGDPHAPVRGSVAAGETEALGSVKGVGYTSLPSRSLAICAIDQGLAAGRSLLPKHDSNTPL